MLPPSEYFGRYIELESDHGTASYTVTPTELLWKANTDVTVASKRTGYIATKSADSLPALSLHFGRTNSMSDLLATRAGFFDKFFNNGFGASPASVPGVFTNLYDAATQKSGTVTDSVSSATYTPTSLSSSSHPSGTLNITGARHGQIFILSFFAVESSSADAYTMIFRVLYKHHPCPITSHLACDSTRNKMIVYIPSSLCYAVKLDRKISSFMYKDKTYTTGDSVDFERGTFSFTADTFSCVSTSKPNYPSGVTCKTPEGTVLDVCFRNICDKRRSDSRGGCLKKKSVPVPVWFLLVLFILVCALIASRKFIMSPS